MPRFFARLALFVLLAPALSGCIAELASPRVASEVADAHDRHPLWVHRAGGVEVAASAFPGELPAFEQVEVTQRMSGEPTIAITRSGALFYAAIDLDASLPGPPALGRTVLYRSIDQGETWEDASPNYAGVRTHPVTNDPYVYADPTTGRLFQVDLGWFGAECNAVSHSKNDGRTWRTQYLTCPVPFVDHPTLFAGPRGALPSVPQAPGQPGWTELSYPNLVYLCAQAIVATHCAVSNDGGLTWVAPTVVAADGVEPTEALPDMLDPPPFDDDYRWLCGGATGHGHASWADGTVYLPRTHCAVPTVYVSHDQGLTWETTVVATGDQYRSQWDTLDAVHDAMLHTDAAGNAYAFWIGGNGTRAYLSVSRDQGRTWERPLDVTAPGVTAAKLPSIVAGGPGRVAFQYVGTETPSGWDIHQHDPAAHDIPYEWGDASVEEWLDATWNVYIGVSLDADAADPVFATTTAHPIDEPVKRGGCLKRCPGSSAEGGMYDFLDIDIDPTTGRIWSAFVDVCTLACDDAHANAEAPTRSHGAVGRQVAGARLLEEPMPVR